MERWEDVIRWVEQRDFSHCEGDRDNVIRDLLRVVRVLGTQIDEMQFKIITLECEVRDKRMTSFERVLGEMEK